MPTRDPETELVRAMAMGTVVGAFCEARGWREAADLFQLAGLAMQAAVAREGSPGEPVTQEATYG